MNYLSFDLSDGDGASTDDGSDGVITLEALAATPADQHAAVMAEVQQVLDWAWRRFPHSHGPADAGMDWDHDLQISAEPGGWHAVALTLTGSHAFVEAFVAVFGESMN